MRSLITLVSLSLLAPVASADRSPATPARAPLARQPAPAPAPAPAPIRAPRPRLVPIDLVTVPERCHEIARRAGSPRLPVALSARLSLASCAADAKLATLSLIDSGESVLAVEASAAHSFELLDEVIAKGDPVTKVIAELAKAELYTMMVVRMLATVPPAGTTEASIALHQSRKALLESQLVPWRDQASAAFTRIVERANANPALTKNPVVAAAVRTSKDRLRVRVASVTPPPPVDEPEPDAAPEATDTEELP